MHKLSKLNGREIEVGRLYASGMSVQKISKLMECGDTATRTALNHSGVQIRSATDAQLNRAGALSLSEDERCQLDAERRRSLKEWHREYGPAWADRNRAHLTEYQANWRAGNQDSIREYRQAYGKKNRAAISAKKRQWRLDNPQKFKAEKARRRALEKSAVGIITEEQWLAKLESYGHRCAYCLDVLAQVTQDHVVPLSRGGTHIIDNVVPACRSCNSKKKDGDKMVPFSTEDIYL